MYIKNENGEKGMKMKLQLFYSMHLPHIAHPSPQYKATPHIILLSICYHHIKQYALCKGIYNCLETRENEGKKNNIRNKRKKKTWKK